MGPVTPLPALQPTHGHGPSGLKAYDVGTEHQMW